MTTRQAAGGVEVPQVIASHGHWRVLVRPSEFVPDRLGSTEACLLALERSRVSVRGWDYPWIDRGDIAQRGSDFVSGFVEYGIHTEFWTMWQSGQFVHHFRFWEDSDASHDANTRKRLEHVLQKAPPGFEPNGYVDPTGIVYTLTEIHEFAKRLAAAAGFDEAGLVLEVSLAHIERRLLMASEIHRAWWGFHPATVDELVLPRRQLPVAAFGATYKELAVDAALWIFDKFGWNPPRELIEADQERFYARKF